MQTNPEQWAQDLFWAALKAGDNNNYEAAYAVIQAAFAEREARLVGALEEIRDLHGEINPSNYDHDDACELNRQFCYAITVADAALKDRTHG